MVQYSVLDIVPVSYTHLDVYKRQAWSCLQIERRISSPTLLQQENCNDAE